MRRSLVWVTAGVAGLIWSAPLAHAQASGPGPPATQPSSTATQPADVPETVDVADLIRMLRKKPPSPRAPAAARPRSMRAIAPVIGVRPSSGVMIGVAGNVAYYTGDAATTRISSGTGSLTLSSKGQTSLTTRLTMFGPRDQSRFEGDYRFQWTSQDTFGLGIPTELSDPLLVNFDFYRLHQSAYVQLRPSLFVGGGLHFDRHANVSPAEGEEGAWLESPYVEYSNANGLPLDTQTSAGPSVALIWDDRDNFINADRGWLASASYRWLVEDFLGGDSSWDKVTLDLRTYQPLTRTGHHKLAVWAFADTVVRGVAPYFDLPSTGSDAYGRSGRGYAEGHFRGERLAFVELEYRGRLMENGLLGMVAFVNATTVADPQSGQALFDRVAPGGGAGLRLLINKRSRTNLAFDIGFGEKGNKGVYLAVQEAF
jgi:outer membrane protein assembly factor BamA